MTKSKLSALLSLVMVFVSGGVVGAFAYRLYSVPTVTPGAGPGGPPNRRPTPAEFRKRYVEDITTSVKLDGQQVQKLNQILDETNHDMDALREKSKPDWDAFNKEREALDKERDAIRDKWRPSMDTIHAQQVDRINAMLREDQRPLYTAFRAERDRQRKLREQQQQNQHKK